MTVEEFYARLVGQDPIAQAIMFALLALGTSIGDKAPYISFPAELYEAGEKYGEEGISLIIEMAAVAGRTKTTPFGKVALTVAIKSYEALLAEAAKGN